MRKRALAELGLAIASEQVATAALKAASSSMSPLFLVLSVSGYVSAIVWFGRSLRVLPMGLAYRLWVALGMASRLRTGVDRSRGRLGESRLTPEGKKWMQYRCNCVSISCC